MHARTLIVLLLFGGSFGVLGCQSVPEMDRSIDPDAELALLHDAIRETPADAPQLRWDELRLQADRIVQRSPRHAGALATAGVLAQRVGDDEAAQVLLDRALAADPMARGAAVARAQVALDAGNLELAAVVLERYLRLAPADAAACEALGGVRFLEGDWQRSEDSLRDAQALGAPVWRVAYHLGLVHERRGELDAARAAYQQVLRALPGEPRATERLRALEMRAARAPREP